MVWKDVNFSVTTNPGFKPKAQNKIVGQWTRPQASKPQGKVGPIIRLQPGECPCATCNHQTMEECYVADCQCCTTLCT